MSSLDDLAPASPAERWPRSLGDEGRMGVDQAGGRTEGAGRELSSPAAPGPRATAFGRGGKMESGSPATITEIHARGDPPVRRAASCAGVKRANLVSLLSPGGAYLAALDLQVDVLEKSTLRVALPAGAHLELELKLSKTDRTSLWFSAGVLLAVAAAGALVVPRQRGA